MIVAVAASGRGNSNSTHLAQTALSASGAADQRVHHLARLAFKGCIGCGACRKDADACALDDGLTPVLADVARADAVIVASPNYYGYVSGILKAFLDRWYSFRDGQRRLRLPEPRPLLMVMSQGHPDPKAYEAMLGQLEKIYRGYGFAPRFLVGAGLEAPGAAHGRADLADEARRLGEQISIPL